MAPSPPLSPLPPAGWNASAGFSAGQTARLVATPTAGVLTFVAGLYIYLIYSRQLELIHLWTGGLHIPYLMSLLAGLMLVGAVFSGRAGHIGENRSAVFFTVFTVWAMMCVPTSVWRGGSVTLLMQWVPVVVGLLGLAGLLRTRTNFSWVAKVMAVSCLVISLGMARLARYGADDGRASLAYGTLGNGNELANLICLGMPFFLLPLLGPRWGKFGKLIALPAIGLLSYFALRTGSRAALITIVVIFIGAFLLGRGASRVVMIAMLVIGPAAVLLLMPAQIYQRLTYMVTGGEGSTEAVLSQRGRSEKLVESIFLTLRNPILGVGPGVHDAAMARDDKEAGVRPDYLVSHNSVTQVSSETGLPGLLLYAMAAYVPLWRGLKIRKKIKQIPALQADVDLLSVFMLSLAAVSTNTLFSSSAYLSYLPVMAVLTECYVRALQADVRVLQSAPAASFNMPAASFTNPGGPAVAPPPNVFAGIPAASAPPVAAVPGFGTARQRRQALRRV